jgi:ABC-type polysaccharide/polyol phosphate export permease
MTDTATSTVSQPFDGEHGGFVLTPRPAPIRSLIAATWRSRELIAILAKKDFFVRYRRATLGLLWAAALPLFQAVVLSFVLQRFVRFHVPGNYAVFVLAGMTAWSTFSSILMMGSTAIVDGSGMSSKIYFPRLIFPLVSVFSTAYGLAISVGVLMVMAVATGVGLNLHALALIPAFFLTLALAASFVIVLSALHVYFRDMRYVVQAAMLVWLYVTPVIYPLNAVGGLRKVLLLNPVTGLVELYRFATVGADHGWLPSLIATNAFLVVALTVGLVLHRRFDRLFGDLL